MNYDEERQHRILARLTQELVSDGPMRWWYLSFATDDGFRGGCFLEAQGEGLAILRSHELGINPGGQVLIIEAGDHLPPEDMRNRLLTRSEVMQSL